MARLSFLDGEPLGLASQARGKLKADACRGWLQGLEMAGARILIPEIVDDELRGELVRDARRPASAGSSRSGAGWRGGRTGQTRPIGSHVRTAVRCLTLTTVNKELRPRFFPALWPLAGAKTESVPDPFDLSGRLGAGIGHGATRMNRSRTDGSGYTRELPSISTRS